MMSYLNIDNDVILMIHCFIALYKVACGHSLKVSVTDNTTTL